MKRLLMIGVLSLLPVAASSAQERPAEGSRPQAQGQAQAKPGETGQAVNVRIDLTITDQGPAAAPVGRTVTLLAADGTSGRIRTVTTSGPSGTLNVDTRPRLLEGDRVQLSLTVEYRPAASGNTEVAFVSESMVVILQDGKPLVISQSADPASDRKVKLEVKATVLK